MVNSNGFFSHSVIQLCLRVRWLQKHNCLNWHQTSSLIWPSSVTERTPYIRRRRWCTDHADWCYTSATRAHLSVYYLSDVCSNASEQRYPISGGALVYSVQITQTGATLVLRELISLSITSQMFALMHLNRDTLYPAALVYRSRRLVLH